MADLSEVTITLKPDEVVAALLQINQKLDALVDAMQALAGQLADDDECPMGGDHEWRETTGMGADERKFVCLACKETKTEAWE